METIGVGFRVWGEGFAAAMVKLSGHLGLGV